MEKPVASPLVASYNGLVIPGFLAVLALVGLGEVGVEVAAHLDLSALRGASPSGDTGEGPSILVIGDSHVNGSFGRRLHADLRAEIPGARVHVIGACGRWSNAWVKGLRAHCGLRIIDDEARIRWGEGCQRNPCSAGDSACRRDSCRTPSIEHLVDALQPDLTIVQLGGNSMFRSTVRAQWRNIAPTIEELVRLATARGGRCLWVTPPHGLNKSRNKMAHFRDFLADATAGYCHVFDSGPTARPYLDYEAAVAAAGRAARHQDGIHYDRLGHTGRARLARWAREVAGEAADVLDEDGLLAVGELVSELLL